MFKFNITGLKSESPGRGSGASPPTSLPFLVSNRCLYALAYCSPSPTFRDHLSPRFFVTSLALTYPPSLL